ncbi:MAG: LysR family transcriptional regulator [Aquabacterium sp.]|nr:LysR family transcriptional regulator [Aquabacterium sp.]
MDQLRAMQVLAKVADEGSFAAAARALDMAPAVVTRVIAELEEHLGARLMNRTTRRMNFTEVGDEYLQRVRQILADVDDAAVRVGNATVEPRGHLRVLLPPALAVHQVVKHLGAFRRLYPQVTVELHSPGPVEAMDEAYDLTILSTRQPLAGDFIARRLARTEVVLCAAPDYLDTRGRPSHPQELAHHDTLLPPISEVQRGITFLSGGEGPDDAPGESVTLIPHRPVLSSSHIDTNYAGALHGLGITALPSFVLEDALLENALERVLPDWRLFSITIWAAMPSRKHLPARTRVFLDFLINLFGGEDKDPWLMAAACATPLRAPTPPAAPMPQAAPAPQFGAQPQPERPPERAPDAPSAQ